jgi:D-alanyl-D-alanine carboxypeptidase
MISPSHSKSILIHTVPTGIVFFIMIGVFLFQQKELWSLNKEVLQLKNEIASTTLAVNTTSNELTQKFTDLHNETQGISTTLSSTKETIDTVKSQVGGVEQAVGSISGTVGVLKKLSEVDLEILKKYSKVYFMNENYTPAHLTIIPPDYTYSSARQEQFLSEAWPNLKSLLDAAQANDVKVYVKSGYRSFTEQKSLKSRYSVIYGKGTANTFSADQGYSEHQLGTAVDFITPGLGGQLTGFDSTKAYTWLTINAHKFGFVLSYPKGNAYYIYEPWHWRYVGTKLATYLHSKNLNFYDLDQREIDTYLVHTFDN